jgi:radical SAM enzyme (TIGR01210 family)
MAYRPAQKNMIDPSQKIALRTRLVKLARQGIRYTIPETVNINRPASARSDTVTLGNETLTRRRIVLITRGCSVATCTMCPLPGEAVDPARRQIVSKNLIAQFDAAYSAEDKQNHDLVTVYNNGNFFDDHEIPSDVRKYIYQQIASSGAKILSVESLPQFINESSIKEIKECLGNKKIMVSIGLQSADDTIRELAIDSTCTRPAFENAIKLLSQVNGIVQPFLMIKPPFVTEAEAIDDAVSSVKYLYSLGITDSILCSTRVAPHTVLKTVHQKGMFNSPWIWSVVKVLQRCATEVPEAKPRISLGELKMVGKEDSILTHNCQKCTDKLVDLISQFNLSHDIHLFDGFTCDCYVDYQKAVATESEKYANATIPERIKNFLDISLT